MADDDESSHSSVIEQEERKARIKKIVGTIAEKSKGFPKKKVKSKMADCQGTPPKQDVRSARPPKRTVYKLHMGWLHYDDKKNRYKQVHAKNGGGTRVIEFQKDKPETIQTLLERGKKLFFPNGKSGNGQFLATTDVCLSSYNGTEISEFKDDKGNCSLQDFLKSQGIFSSQYYIYIRTKRQTFEEENSLTKSKFLVDGKYPKQIEIKYIKECSSMYSDVKSYITCNSMKSCFEFTSSADSTQKFENYNPFEDGYMLKKLKVSDQVVYERDQSGEATYFEGNNTFMDFTHINVGGDCFLFTPHQLQGYELSSPDCEHLIFAVVTNMVNPFIVWYRNGEEILSGINISAVCVSTPGIYTVGMKHSDLMYMVDPPLTVTLAKPLVQSDHGTKRKLHDNDVGNILIPMTAVNTTEEPESKTPYSNIQDFITPTTAVDTTIELESKTPCSNIQDFITPTTAVDTTLEPESKTPCSNIQDFITPTTAVDTTEEPENKAMRSNIQDFITLTTVVDTTGEPKSKTPDSSMKDFITQTTAVSSTHEKVGVPNIPFAQIEIGKEIGRGGFGTVYKASWLGTDVAVKEMTIKRMRMSRKMIEREMTIHSEVRHPNILLLLAFSTNVNKLYLVTEFIDGSNLDEILFGGESEMKVLNLENKVLIAKKITQAVAYLHNQSTPIIHGDIKPENVLISSDLTNIRLCDMGLSKMKSMNTIVTTLAHSSSLQPGTPAYMAPEILIHKQSVSSNSDIWSLACTILELMCSVPCWKCDTEDDLVFITTKMKGKVQPDAMQDIMMQGDIPKNILSILNQSLNYFPEGRPTALNVLKALV